MSFWNVDDEITAAKLNQHIVVQNFTLGETIAVNLPVYLKASDGKIYKTSSAADDEKIHSFIGFLQEAGNANDVKHVQISGKVSNLSGLTAGSKVYLADTAGTYSHTAGTYEKLIGIAVSTTALVLRTAPEGMLTQKAQAVTGVKTFGSIPVLPASDPTTDNQASRKVYADLFSYYVASDSLIASADTERTVSSIYYTKVKEIKCLKGGVFRITFELKATAGYSTYGQIYKNGVAVGTERATNSTTYVSYSEDITAYFPSDLIQLYIKGNASDKLAYAQNFRIKGSPSKPSPAASNWVITN